MGVSVSLDWEMGDAPKDVARDLEQLGDATKPAMRKAATTTTLAIEGQAKRNVPVDTGRLRSSIKSTVSVQGPLIRGSIGSNVKYAPHVEYGTRPHKIGGGLRFKWPNAPASEQAYFMSIGSWPYVMYDEVQHPGTEPTFFLSRAVESERLAFYRRVRRAMRKAERKASDD